MHKMFKYTQKCKRSFRLEGCGWDDTGVLLYSVRYVVRDYSSFREIRSSGHPLCTVDAQPFFRLRSFLYHKYQLQVLYE